MCKLLLVAALCLAYSCALSSSYELVHDELGQAYYMVPITRTRRAVDWDVRKPGIGVIQDRRNIFENENHRVDSTVFAEKNFATHGNNVGGGKVDYTHIPSGSKLSVLGQHTEHRGDDLGVKGQWNIYQKGNAGVDLEANYKRHYGGPGGTRDPSFGAMLNGHIDF